MSYADAAAEWGMSVDSANLHGNTGLLAMLSSYSSLLETALSNGID